LEKFEMKKSLIALAVLAAAGAASAQSTVTLYGIADVWVGQTAVGVGAAHLTQTEVGGGGLSTSRWGLKGTEDLGGGLKANFTLEQGFAIDKGDATSGFDRVSKVGISGNFGAVDLGGNMATAYDDILGATNNLANTNRALTATVWGRGIGKYGSRFDNSIKFTSAKMSGFSGALQVGLGEDKNTAVGATTNTSLNIMYGAGPLVVGLGYQTETAPNATNATVTASSMDSTIIGASYNFGVVKVEGSYNTINKAGVKDTGYQLGLDIPVSSAATVLLGYVNMSGDNAAGATYVNAKGFSLGGLYALSKRTTLYGAYTKDSADNNVFDTQDNSLFAVGVKHTF